MRKSRVSSSHFAQGRGEEAARHMCKHNKAVLYPVLDHLQFNMTTEHILSHALVSCCSKLWASKHDPAGLFFSSVSRGWAKDVVAANG